MDERKLSSLKEMPVPEPGPGAKERALAASLAAFREHQTQGSGLGRRLRSIFNPNARRWTMERRMAFGAAAASIAVVAVAAQFALDRGGDPLVWLRPGPEAHEEASDAAPKLESRLVEADEAEGGEGRSVLSRRDAAGTLADRNVAAGEDAAAPQPAPTAEVRIGQAGRQMLVPTAPPAGLAYNRSVAMSPSPAEPTIAPPLELTGRDQFTDFDSNPVKTVAEHPVSTFSVDVDTASYAFVRRMLREGRLPPEDAVRVEEMINYFDYSYPAAESAEQPFRPTVAVYQTPWNPDTKILHVGIKGYEIAADAKPRSNLVFLIDVSGSMESADKLPLLKSAFRLLLDNLDDEDTVSIVTYAGQAGTALEPTAAGDRRKILSAIDGLGAGGSTAGAAGIETAYGLAEEAFVEGGINRVILATDGDFNVGISDPAALEDYIERKRESGVYLSVLGFGAGNYNDALMQTLAQNGNGNAAYIDTLNEAQKVLVDEAGSTLVPIAGDVKIQVEFNPATVAEYRLIGYETRALAREDFNNDRVDAGDVGSGHTVTALYELTPVGSPARLVDDLRYGSGAATATGGASDEYAFLRLRYKLPGEDESRLIERPVTTADELGDIGRASDDMRFAAAVAAFGQKLRAGVHIGDYGYDEIAELAAGARGADPYGYRNEFLSLVRLAGSLDAGVRR